MIGQREALQLFGCEVFDPEGQRVGIVGQLFLDEETEHPAWVAVQTGLFGTNENFVPLEGAAFDGDTLTVAVLKDSVRRAPRFALEQRNLLPRHAQEALYLHYGAMYGVAPDSAERGDSGELAPEYVDAVRLRLRRWVAAM